MTSLGCGGAASGVTVSSSTCDTKINGNSAASTSGAGGGGGYNSNGGAGGSGIVILAIPVVYYSGIYTGSLTMAPYISGGNTILSFAGSGSYTAG